MIKSLLSAVTCNESAFLDDLVGRMSGITSSIDEGFEAIGQGLAPLSASLDELMALQDASADALRDKALAPIRDPQLQGQIERDVEASMRTMSQCSELLERQNAHLLELLKPVVSLNQLNTLLTVIRSNFAIETSRNAKCANLFASYCENLERLVANTAEAVESIESLSRRQIAQQSKAIAALAKERQRLDAIALEAKSQIEAALMESEKAFEAELERASARRQAMERARQALGELIFLNQYGDIFRQRCEHAQTALQEAAARPLRLGRQSKEELRGVLRIQTAQLEEMEEEATSVIERLRAAVDQISRDGRLLENSDTGSGPSPREIVQLLKLRQEAIGNLQSEARACIRQAKERVARLAKELERLRKPIGPLRELIIDLVVNALNATVQTARLGDSGGSLAVLSSRVQTLADHASDAVDQIACVIERLDSGESVAETEQTPDISSLERCDWDTLLDDLAHTGQKSCEVGSRLQGEIRRALDLEDALRAFIDDLAQARGRAIAIDKRYARHRVRYAEASGYTMASERETHAAAAGASPESAARKSLPNEETIELF